MKQYHPIVSSVAKKQVKTLKLYRQIKDKQCFYQMCNSKISRFIKDQEATGMLSRLRLKLTFRSKFYYYMIFCI